MKKIVILFSGEGLNAQNIVKKLHNKNCIVTCGITNKKDANGIKRLNDLGVKTQILQHVNFNSREEFDAELVKLIKAQEPDLVVLSGFMRILSNVFTSNIKAINLHPSLLPKYKGAKAIEQSYNSNDSTCGVSVHWVSSELDGGKVILQKSFQRSQDDTFESFTQKIKQKEFEIMPEAIIETLK
jgi:phosphoribosylglycinamide formyltransferase-1